MAKIEVMGTVERVTIQNEKSEAQMVVLIPVKTASDIPMGKVSISIEKLQGEMAFPGGAKVDDKPSKRDRMRGDRG